MALHGRKMFNKNSPPISLQIVKVKVNNGDGNHEREVCIRRSSLGTLQRSAIQDFRMDVVLGQWATCCIEHVRVSKGEED